MKLKLRYFIRGLGIGIVFTAIVMSLSLQAARSRIIRENALTKEEIMEKAMGYGMILDSTEDTSIEQNEDESKDVDEQQKENNNTESDKEEVGSSTDAREDEVEVEQETNDSGKDSDKESDIESDKDTDKETEKESDTDTDKDKIEENTKEPSYKEDSIISIDYIPVKITSGMTAADVGRLLKEKKVIEDVDEFRSYMSEQGYSSKILIGNYLIPVDATYKKIANIITKK